VTKQIDALKNIAITLAMNLKAQGATTQLAHLAPVFRLFQKETIPSWILRHLPPIIIDSFEYDEANAQAFPSQHGDVGITLSLKANEQK
jgi:hypothetical protein